MNIQEAKLQIQRTVSIYLMKDEFGSYRIPLQEQRPVFMIGAPGIGKTAIMAQIAEELNVSLVSYAMTHHTRQSALGLPMIAHRTYQGREFEVSEYTLSEILSTVYETMERSGKKEGILFLDEINCVSETLGPSMLQFLQYKTFGNHSLPQGWVVVTAGNPQEYNRAVHPFDIATLDRLKVLNVEPDYAVWKQYAEQRQIHPAILSYLEVRSDDFYCIENTADGRACVTARGWEDLSEAMRLYEEKGYPIDETLITQYLSHPRIASSFATWYELFRRYRSDYQIGKILAGSEDPAIAERLHQASYDEEISVAGLLLEHVQPLIRRNMETEESLRGILPFLRQLKQECAAHPGQVDLGQRLQAQADSIHARMKQEEAAGSLSPRRRRVALQQRRMLAQMKREAGLCKAEGSGFAAVQKCFDSMALAMREEAAAISGQLDHLLAFGHESFPDEEGMIIVLSQLIASSDCARFIAEHGCPRYFQYAEDLNLEKRHEGLLKEMRAYQAQAAGDAGVSLK